MKLIGSLATSRHDMISLYTQKRNARQPHAICRIIIGAIDYLRIVAKVALQVQKEDNS